MLQWNSTHNLKKLLLFCIGLIFLFDSHACLGMHNNEEDYETHQKVSTSFFRVNPKKEETVNILKKFKEEYTVSPIVSSIKLDGLSPRSRILLLRSISQEIFKRYEGEKKFNVLYGQYSYFKEYQGMASSKETVKYIFGPTNFTVRYIPTDVQPGNLVIEQVPECRIFCQGLNNSSNKNRSKEVSKIIFNQYKQKIAQKNNHANHLTIFFDFEIARRLIQDVPENEYDTIPIASAILNFLYLTQISDEHHISDLFKPSSQWDFYAFGDMETTSIKHNVYNPFMNEAWIREAATKNILLDINKKTNKKLKEEEILERYYDFFGGKEED